MYLIHVSIWFVRPVNLIDKFQFFGLLVKLLLMSDPCISIFSPLSVFTSTITMLLAGNDNETVRLVAVPAGYLWFNEIGDGRVRI